MFKLNTIQNPTLPNTMFECRHLESLTCVFDSRNVNFSEPANELPFLIADASKFGKSNMCI